MRRIAAAVLMISLTACASGGGAGGPARSRNVISQEEIDQATVPNALELVQTLRPQFLRPRGTTGSMGAASSVVAYLDGRRIGDIGELSAIPRGIVGEIRYVDANEATLLYGTGHAGGAILVVTRR